MLFTAILYPKVLDGTKTQTRRLAQPGDKAYAADGSLILNPFDASTEIVAVVRNGREKYRVTKAYAVQPGRGKPAGGYVVLASIRYGDVRQITDDDITAEGFTRYRDFMDVWTRLNDPKAHGIFGDPRLVSSEPAIHNYIRTRPAELYTAWALSFWLVPSSFVMRVGPTVQA